MVLVTWPEVVFRDKKLYSQSWVLENYLSKFCFTIPWLERTSIRTEKRTDGETDQCFGNFMFCSYAEKHFSNGPFTTFCKTSVSFVSAYSTQKGIKFSQQSTMKKAAAEQPGWNKISLGVEFLRKLI